MPLVCFLMINGSLTQEISVFRVGDGLVSGGATIVSLLHGSLGVDKVYVLNLQLAFWSVQPVSCL